MYRKLRTLTILLIVASICFLQVPAFALVAMSDEAVLGNDRWSVQSDGDLVPGADSSQDIGASGSEVANLYVDDLTIANDVTFRTSLVSIGRISASSSLASSSTSVGSSNLAYGVIRKFLGAGAEATTLPNGIPGQVVNIVVVESAGGVWTITPTTSQIVTSWTMTATDDNITLLYMNDSMGWIVLGSDGSTAITYDINRN